MKLSFTTRDVKRTTFLSLAKIAEEYGLDGFEIYDAIKERKEHGDSVLRTDSLSSSRSLLSSKGLSVTALHYPVPLDSEGAGVSTLIEYGDMAAVAGVENIIVSLSSLPEPKALSV